MTLVDECGTAGEDPFCEAYSSWNIVGEFEQFEDEARGMVGDFAEQAFRGFRGERRLAFGDSGLDSGRAEEVDLVAHPREGTGDAGDVDSLGAGAAGSEMVEGSHRDSLPANFSGSGGNQE